MSDTTAFLAGCAVTGFAALLLLRGGFFFNSSDTDSTSPPPVPELTSPVPVSPSLNDLNSTEESSNLRRELDRQKAIAEALRNELEDQQDKMRDLESTLKTQQTSLETVTTQIQAHQQFIDETTQLRTEEQTQERLNQSANTQTSMVLAVGGIVVVLIVGGSVVLVCVIVLLVQPNRQPPRTTTHIIHPPNIPPVYPYIEQGFLPPAQPRTRRTNYIDYDG